MPSRPFRAPFTRVMLTAACLACFATAVFAFDADRTPVAVRQYSAPALRKPAHRPIVAGMQAGLPTPYSALRSLDGAWLAANVRMKQEGWGMLLLYENQQLVRAMQGWQAVDFETHGDRILIVESTPDDDPWYALVHRTSANDVDMGDMKPRRIHSANQWKYVGWIAPTVLEFEHIDATHRRERVDLATLKPDQ